MSTCPRIPPTPLVAPSLQAPAPCSNAPLPCCTCPSVLFTRSPVSSSLTSHPCFEANLCADKVQFTTPGYHNEYQFMQSILFHPSISIPSSTPAPPPCRKCSMLYTASSFCTDVQVPLTPPRRVVKVNQGKVCAESLVIIIGKVMNALYISKFS